VVVLGLGRLLPQDSSLSDRLRRQVELDELTAELLVVVEETMQPTQASLWLRRPSPSGTGQCRHGRATSLREPTPGEGSGRRAGRLRSEADLLP
jgi:hypothetical protein